MSPVRPPRRQKQLITKDYLFIELEWGPNNRRHVYHVSNPARLLWTPGESTQIVKDSTGIEHVVPALGVEGCVMRYKKAPVHAQAATKKATTQRATGKRPSTRPAKKASARTPRSASS